MTRFEVAREVARALERRRPVVALETSVVAQGLPWPHNLTSALECADAIRSAGAVPAAVGVIDGAVHVGLDERLLLRLAREPSASEGRADHRLMKLGSSDLAPALAAGRTGGTTVSATSELAARLGVRVFATGGIGGVHRGFAEHLDVSQDLGAIARFPVAVVCAGAKSVLDLPATLELLEALAVPVVGVGTSELPGFFTRDTGCRLEHRVETAREAAQVARTRFDGLTQGGLVLAVPPPAETSIDPLEVECHLRAALRAAARRGVRGKATTPFLLAELSRRTRGRTLASNLALLKNNARFAAQVAVEYARLGPARRSKTGRARSAV